MWRSHTSGRVQSNLINEPSAAGLSQTKRSYVAATVVRRFTNWIPLGQDIRLIFNSLAFQFGCQAFSAGENITNLLGTANYDTKLTR